MILQLAEGDEARLTRVPDGWHIARRNSGARETTTYVDDHVHVVPPNVDINDPEWVNREALSTITGGICMIVGTDVGVSLRTAGAIGAGTSIRITGELEFTS